MKEEYKKDFAVIMVNYNCFSDTKKILECLYKATSLIDIFLVDNCSTKDSVAEIQRETSDKKNVFFFSLKKNIGFAGGCNVAIKDALTKKYRYIFLLNPDTIIRDNDFFFILRKEIEVVGADIAGPLIKYYPDDRRIYFAGGFISRFTALTKMRGKTKVDDGQYVDSEKCDFITGSAMAVRSDVFKKIGLLPEEYFLYFEESDFCMKANKAGLSVWFLPKAQLYHKVSKSIGYLSDVYLYFMIRNYRMFAMKYVRDIYKPIFLFYYLFIWVVGYIFLSLKQKNMKGLVFIFKGFLGIKI